MNETLFHILVVVGVLLGTVTIAAALIYVERKALALWQQRHGPNRVGPFGLFQVVADVRPGPATCTPASRSSSKKTGFHLLSTKRFSSLHQPLLCLVY